MESLLEAISNLENDVDIGLIFISLIQKLGNYFGKYTNKLDDNNMSENDRQILEMAQNIYPALLKNFNGFMNQNLNISSNSDRKAVELSKLLDLVSSFLTFSLKCSPSERKFESINNIYSIAIELINKQRHKLNEDCVNKIGLLLTEPLNNGINIFQMKDFVPLMDFLNYKNKKKLGISLMEALIKDSNQEKPILEKIDSLESLDKVLKFIRPLLGDNRESSQEEDYTYDYEQNIVSKIVHIIKTNNPETIYKILNDLKNIFSHGGPNRRKYTLPPLANRIIQFCHDITVCYENKVGLLSENIKNNNYTKKTIESLDINRIKNDQIFLQLLLNIYKLLTETLDLISQEQPEMAFNLFLESASQVNSISCNKENFEESCITFINSALNILDEGRYDQRHKYKMLQQISSIILTLKINKDKIETMIENIIKISQKIGQREEQFKVMLIIAQLYFVLFKDSKKVMDCLNRARRFADFAMTNPRNLVLFIEYLNQILYFIEEDEKVIDIKPEQIVDIIELIKGHIRTIKNIPSDDIDFLEYIEVYFNNTLMSIEYRKKNSNKKDYYLAINL
jgi:vacuolar protein sorting-associated protein 35